MEFESYIKKSKSMITSDDIYLFKQKILDTSRFARKIKAENQEASNEELLEIMDKILLDWVIYVDPSFSIPMIQLWYQVEESIENPKIAMDKMKKMGILKLLESKDKNIAINNFEWILGDIYSAYSTTYKAKMLDKYIIAEITQKEEKILIKDFIIILKNVRRRMNQKIRTSLTQQIVETAKVLEKFGVLDKYVKNNNLRLEKMNLHFLKIPLKREKNDDKLTLHAAEDLYNEKIIAKLDLMQAIVIASFLINRVAKVVDNYIEALYFIRKLNIIDVMFNDENILCNNKIFNDKIIKEVIVQYKYIKKNSESFLKNLDEQIFADSQKSNSSIKVKKINEKMVGYEIPIDKFCNKYQDRYNKYYSKVLNICNNVFREDYLFLAKKYNYVELIYEIKEQVATALLEILFKEKNNVKWGCILDEHESLKSNKNYILLGFDLKGYNVPVKLHFDKKKLIKNVKEYTNDTIIPVYEGNNDMYIESSNFKFFFTTQILMPLTEKQKKELKKIYKSIDKNDYRYNFISHIYNMINLSKRKTEKNMKKIKIL